MQDTGDYISRDAAKKQMRNGRHSVEWLLASGAKTIGDSFEIILDEVPAADVRPVVLCRDCDSWNDWDSSGKESLGNFVCSCAHWSVEDGPVLYTRPDDFCSYGEKREES